MALELIRQMAQTASDCQFVLLTLERNDKELARLDAPNVMRLPVDIPGPGLKHSNNFVLHARQRLRRLLPPSIVDRIAALYRNRPKRARSGLVWRLEADLLFCPFTALDFYDPAVPAVSVIHDLQYRYYPQFFDPADARRRQRAFDETCRVAKYIVCASMYVRRTILENADVAPERIEVIPIVLPHRVSRPEPAVIEEALRSLGVASGDFLLYPANFWPHKNHEALLRGFSMYLAANSARPLKLVLTGAPGPRRDAVLDICRRDPALSAAVSLPGYVPEANFAALLWGCRAIIFPSLFEGFGMPLLEAMAAAKPILASNATSLPEVAGDAAFYFDPARPDQIRDAIMRLQRDQDFQRTLGERAAARLCAFGAPEDMAARYLEVFRAALG